MLIVILVVAAIWILGGVIIVTAVTAVNPMKVVHRERYRYDLAFTIILLWPFSIFFFIGWAVTWPSRKLVARKVKLV